MASHQVPLAKHKTEWVLPGRISFSDLKGRDLEECVYWLLDAMGARDLEWRTGGTGGGAADDGRDIEATFYTASPDGEMESQRWWIECKGRNGTVEPGAVKEAVLNSQSQNHLAHLVIVTNSIFSNPTRDWIKDWQNKNPRPRVKLWDQSTLERFLSKHPSVVLRLFSDALSPAGLLNAVEQRFWERLEYMPMGALKKFCNERNAIEISPQSRFALITNEFAHGNINDRPWAAYASQEELLQTLQTTFVQFPQLALRIAQLDVEQGPVLAALAHLVVVALQFSSPSAIATLLLESITREGDSLVEEPIEGLLLPVIHQVSGEMRDICSADCERVYAGKPNTLVSPEDPIRAYWRRLDSDEALSKPTIQGDLVIEKRDAICKVGFAVDSDHRCPLFESSFDLAPSKIGEFLVIVEQVSKFRLTEARERAAAERVAAVLRNRAAGSDADI